MPKYRSSNESEMAGCFIFVGILILCIAVGFAWGPAIGWGTLGVLLILLGCAM